MHPHATHPHEGMAMRCMAVCALHARRLCQLPIDGRDNSATVRGGLGNCGL